MPSLSTALNVGTLSRKYRFIKTMYLNIMWLGGGAETKPKPSLGITPAESICRNY